jgi:hypothetical protein
MTRHDTIAHVVGDTAAALSKRPGELDRRRAERTMATAGMIMAFRPGDVIEAMIASHCVMFHELIVDSVHETLTGEDPAARRPARSTIIAMDKAFGDNLARLEAYRTRCAEASPAEVSSDLPEIPARDETDISERIRRHQASAPAVRFTSVEPAAAAVRMSGSNGAAAVSPAFTQRPIYAGNRQARRHPNP